MANKRLSTNINTKSIFTFISMIFREQWNKVEHWPITDLVLYWSLSKVVPRKKLYYEY